jgi:hypothetical protein
MDRKTGSEWVMKAKERVLVESHAEGHAKGSEYRMPVLDAVRGMVVGYVRDGGVRDWVCREYGWCVGPEVEEGGMGARELKLYLTGVARIGRRLVRSGGY